MNVAQLWRHPIKSHGRESVQSVTLEAGKTMPWDRTWAVAHEAAKSDGSEWAQCANYSRGAKAPQLMGINCVLDEQSEQVTLSHPIKDSITVHPERDADALLAWLSDLMPSDRAASAAIHRVAERGMTDTDYPSVSLMTIASNDAMTEVAQTAMDIRRWRGNIWIEGATPWAEFDWVGKRLSIGGAICEVSDRIQRCTATMANPETGSRDIDTLKIMREQLGHIDFGVYLQVVQGGLVSVGDPVTVLE